MQLDLRGFVLPLALCALGFASLAAAAPPPVEELFRKAQYAAPVLSPGARFLAVVAPVQDHRGVAVIDLESRKVVRMEAPGGGDILQELWQTDERLVGVLGDLQQVAGEPPSVFGVVAVNRDGSDPRVIAGPGEHSAFQRPWSVRLVRDIPGTTQLLVEANERSLRSADLYRFDTATGAKTLLSVDSPGAAVDWIVDFDGVPRAVVTHDLDHDTSAWYVRKSPQDPWVKVEEAKLGRLTSQPMQFDPDGKILYVSARRSSEDRAAIYEYKVESGAYGDAIVRHPERDIGPGNARFVSSYRERKLLGLRYMSNRPSVAWFDAGFARVQQAVDAALPDTVNDIQRSANAQRWVVVAHSDRNPGEGYLLDATTMHMEKLYSARPWIDPKTSAPMRWVKYTARDGLVIPALLTLPSDRGDKRVPLVVDIHGGPVVPADAWGYNAEVQFFASRGYAVLQPQFRSTKGFGWKLESSGYRKWGDEMQDDLSDGIRWAVAEGIVDPARVCLYGGSYGGYAALWGAIKQAKEIRCAVSVVGVTSLDYLFDDSTTDVSQSAQKSTLMVEQIGDPKTERARFKRVSPLDHADKVGVPILLAYGASDVRVPLVHGTDFRRALDRSGKPYEWVVYDDEGHGFNRDENVFDYYKRVDAFLAKYLGNPAAPAPR